MRCRECPRGAGHISVELLELMGLGDLDSLKHKQQMHTMGHYGSDEPISIPLWLLKGIHSPSQGEGMHLWLNLLLLFHSCNFINLRNEQVLKCLTNFVELMHLLFAIVSCITARIE